ERRRGRETRSSGSTARGRDRTRNRGKEEDSGESDRESTRAPKRKRTEQYGWASVPDDDVVLSERHMDVIAVSEVYTSDLDQSIEDIRKSGKNPVFPRKLWKAVLKDEYVELSEVLPFVSSLHITDLSRAPTNRFAEALENTTIAKAAPHKAIVDEVTWRKAWYATAEAITFAFPRRKKELEKYEQHIRGFFDDVIPSLHGNVIRYDKALRQLVGSRCDILYDEFDRSECSRIRLRYLFPGGANYEAPGSLGSSRNEFRSKVRAKEICRRFNAGKCEGCDRRHVCSSCRREDHGASKCPKN
ncbi:hypothetical protein GGU11DRAFT_694032, partial [Lentinula aff. detonsa]